MKLTKEERESSGWLAVRTHILARIEGIQVELEKTTNTPDQTAVLRGRIAELRRMLQVEQETKKFNE